MGRLSGRLTSIALLCIVLSSSASCVRAETPDGTPISAVHSPSVSQGSDTVEKSSDPVASDVVHQQDIVLPPSGNPPNHTTTPVEVPRDLEEERNSAASPTGQDPAVPVATDKTKLPADQKLENNVDRVLDDEEEVSTDTEVAPRGDVEPEAVAEPPSEEFDFDRWEVEFKRRAQQLQAEAELLAATMNHRKDPSLSEEEQKKLTNARSVQERMDDLTREVGVSRQRLIFEATKKMSTLIARRNKAFAQLPAFWYTAMKDYLPETFFLTPNPAELDAAVASVENDKERVRQGKVPLSPRGSAPIVDAVLDAQSQESRLQTDHEVFAQFLQRVQCLYLPYDAVAHGENSDKSHHHDGLSSEFISPSKALPEWARRSIVASVDDDDLDEADFALNVKQTPKVGRPEDSTAHVAASPAADSTAPPAPIGENEVALPAEFQHKLTEKLHLHSIHDRYRLILRFRDRAPRLRWGIDPLDPAQDLCPQGYMRKASGGKQSTTDSASGSQAAGAPEPWLEGSLKGDPFLEGGADGEASGGQSLLMDHFPLSRTELIHEVSTGSGGIWDGIQSASPPVDDHGRPHRRLSLYHTTINLKEDQTHLKVHLFNRTFFRAFLPVEEFQALSDSDQRDLQEQLRALVEYACHQSAGDPLVRYENRMLERRWRVQHMKHRQAEDDAAKRESQQRKKLFPPPTSGKDGSDEGSVTGSASASMSIPVDDHEFSDDGAEDSTFSPPPLQQSQQQGEVDQPAAGWEAVAPDL